MTHDVEVFTGRGGWATDMTTGRRRRALDRLHELDRADVPARVLDRYGRDVTQ